MHKLYNEMYCLPGPIWAMALMRSKFTNGSRSVITSQPTGGDAGGEIRNCFSGSGGSRYLLLGSRVSIGV